MNKHRSYSFQSHSFEKAIKPSESKHDLAMKPTENEICKGLNRYFSKDAHQKSEGGSVRSDLKKTRLLHRGNVEKPPHLQFSAQRAPEA